MQCYDKWQTLSVEFSPSQYLKSVIIPFSYQIILFSTFIFVEVILFSICKWLFSFQVLGNLFPSVRNCYSVLPLVGMLWLLALKQQGMLRNLHLSLPGTPASSQELVCEGFFSLASNKKKYRS